MYATMGWRSLQAFCHAVLLKCSRFLSTTASTTGVIAATTALIHGQAVSIQAQGRHENSEDDQEGSYCAEDVSIHDTKDVARGYDEETEQESP